jgi:hypothetical protein
MRKYLVPMGQRKQKCPALAGHSEYDQEQLFI